MRLASNREGALAGSLLPLRSLLLREPAALR